ncbi:hypothetical protein [Nonomuraea sp. NPDC048826]|uniref:hypothetical protein n=1 Tax=Nonomuraea sp. NPDC048826 TaxID=3364347 RepID=UPI00371E6E0A
MTDNAAPRRIPPAHRRRSRRVRRLRRALGLAFARGAAQAAGTGLVGLLFWWLTQR